MSDKIILLVEDNADDVKLALRALKIHRVTNPVVVARDGVEALDYLLGPAAARRKTAARPRAARPETAPHQRLETLNASAPRGPAGCRWWCSPRRRKKATCRPATAGRQQYLRKPLTMILHAGGGGWRVLAATERNPTNPPSAYDRTATPAY
jgi:hypothetical protein